ncbi:MAG: serine/threonine kinase family protein [Myxococcaceae bacterium]|nr:serine/threonine kinase family protein [Myxococcaceae bacterium]
MDHLDEDTLSQLAGGTLAAVRAAAVAEHLAGCKLCEARHQALSAILFSKTFAAPISNTPAPKVQPPSTHPDGPGARTEADEVRLLHKGTSLGRYVLLEKLGSGGMGEVFAAYDPQLDRKVALKLLRTGSLSAHEGKARLVREAQAMARLQHPNVAAVHDVGTFDERVFVAMEFIEGETLSEWLRGQREWKEVVRLFIQCGSGLSAAHRAGIVHRDFKPDNVLIGSDGRPRVVDFGLARQSQTPTENRPSGRPLTDAPLDVTLSSPLTRDGAVMGTPGYMAPEQLAGLQTDARSDQFAFSVALYEALYGKRPFGGTTLKAHAAEIVSGKLPPVPSNTQVPAYVHEAVLRGLSAEPGKRFESLDAMIEKLRPRRVATAGKRFVAALVVMTVIGAVAVGYGVFASRKLQLCSGNEKKLAGIWDPASKTRLKATFLSTNAPFVADAWRTVEASLDLYSRNWVAAAGEACEAARLRKTDTEDDYQLKLRCLGQRLAHLKSVTRRLDAADRTVVTNSVTLVMGLDPVDGCLDASALNARARPPDEKDSEKEAALQQALLDARTLHDSGKYAKGIEQLAAALTIAEGAAPGPLAEAKLLLGRLQARAGLAKDAEATLLSAAVSAQSAGEASLAARAFSRLGMVTGSMSSRFDDARVWQQLALAAAVRVASDKEIEAELCSNAGLVALAEDDPKRAFDEFANALALQKERLGEDNPEVARTLNNQGIAYARLRKYKEAVQTYQRSYELQMKYLGADHPDTAGTMHNLGVMQRKDGQLTEALSNFERALAVRRKTLGDEHPDTATTHLSLANLQIKLENPEAALENLSRALAIRKKVYGVAHPQVAAVYDDLANFYLARRSGKEALENAQQALAIASSAAAHDKAGSAYILLGQWDKAQAELLKALAARQEKFGPDNPEVASALNSLGDLYLAQNKPGQALGYFQKALGLRRKELAEDDLALAYDLLGIGRSHLMLKQPETALEPLTQALKLRESSQDEAEIAAVRYELARALWEARPDERVRATELAAQAREGMPKERQPEVETWQLAHNIPDAGTR